MTTCPDVPIPVQMRSLPLDRRGYPIFFALDTKPDGSPDFRNLNAGRVVICLKGRVCPICGLPLGLAGTFIGGPLSLRTGVFAEPPGHPLCMDYATKVCPFLLRGGWDRTRTDLAAAAAEQDPTGNTAAWEAVGIYVCRTWYPFRGDGGALLIKAGPASRIAWVRGGPAGVHQVPIRDPLKDPAEVLT